MYKYCVASSYTFVQYGFLLRECACTVRGGIILHMTSCSKRGITRSMFKFRFYWGPCKNLFLCDGGKLSYQKLKLTCNQPERTHGEAGRRDIAKRNRLKIIIKLSLQYGKKKKIITIKHRISEDKNRS